MKILILLTTLTVAAIGGCSGGGNTASDKIAFSEVALAPQANKAKMADQADDDTRSQSNVQDTSKKIIRSGDIRFRTENLSKSRSAILSSLKQVNGYVSEEKEFTDEGYGTRNFTLNVRIPAKNFDKFLSEVTETAVQIDSKNITTTDVTTQYIDVTTRLRNQRALEARYLDLLKKATRMADILEVEAKLNEIRTEIESNQGQLNYLMKQVAYSSLEITFYIKRPDFNSSESENRFSRSLKDGWSIMQQLFFGIITLWPIVVAALITIYLIRRWKRRKKSIVEKP